MRKKLDLYVSYIVYLIITHYRGGFNFYYVDGGDISDTANTSNIETLADLFKGV